VNFLFFFIETGSRLIKYEVISGTYYFTLFNFSMKKKKNI
jgi:hypothetical protein